MIACRWLLAPVYVGLALAILALGLKFFQESIHLITHVFSDRETDLVLGILALIDLTLVGSLELMVMMSGSENFVSRIQVDEASELTWIGHLLHPPAAGVHGAAPGPERQGGLVPRVAPHVRGLGAPARRARPALLRRPA
jgi:Uncharacterized protein family, UPF0114